MWLVAFAPRLRSVAHVPPLPILRSMTKPVSLFELSLHARLTDEEFGALAVRFVGAAGGGVTLVGKSPIQFQFPRLPPELAVTKATRMTCRPADRLMPVLEIVWNAFAVFGM